MASCQGKYTKTELGKTYEVSCFRTLYKCPKCGSVGCAKVNGSTCPNAKMHSPITCGVCGSGGLKPV